MVDVVYALHTFEAENEDELTFEAGERIIVLERDDQYSDGWFQVRPGRSALSPYCAPCSVFAHPPLGRQQLHWRTRRWGSHPAIRDGAYTRARWRGERRNRCQNSSLGCVRTLTRQATSQGRNERGEIGLFPQSYTSSTPPSPEPDAALNDDAIAEEPAHGLHTAEATPLAAAAPFAGADSTQPTATNLTAPLVIARRNSVGETSLHSHFTEEEGDEDDAAPTQSQRLSDGAAHRAALAARVSENAERDAQVARELAERRKREDEERYAQNTGQVGLVDGLQLSDESDDEGEEPVESFLPLPAPLPAPITFEGVESVPAAMAAPEEAEERPDVRPRADTEASNITQSDSSLYANQSSSVDVSDNQNNVPTQPLEVPTTLTVAPTPADGDEQQTAPTAASISQDAPRSGEQTPTRPTEESTIEPQDAAASEGRTDAIATAAGAGLAGGFGIGAATALSHHASSDLREETKPLDASHTHVENGAATGIESEIPTSAVSAAGPNDLLPSAPATSVSPPLPHAPRMGSPLVVDTTHTAPPSMTRPVLGTPVSAPNGAFSPASTTRSTASPIVAWDTLPADPIDWTVDNVVDWGQQKGFDESILSKFAGTFSVFAPQIDVPQH